MTKQNFELTYEDAIKALDCCCSIDNDCKQCPVYVVGGTCCSPSILAHFLRNFIERQKAENDDLFYKLTGVMHSVDKWLDKDERKQDEVNRAITMREKTLQIVEKQEAEIERLSKVSILNGLKVVNKERKSIKSEAIKEFKTKLKENVYNIYIGDNKPIRVVHEVTIDKIAEELMKGGAGND